ncbi:DUF1232 domain-containing protein [Synechocystis sp. PCC 7339]|uniref:YkvA family protein n=1 Tax=Synechocystis sp. PCC 7339 TaxID=2782213 RepID=UPI001CBB150B|nr:DUF1232 domain-containing protein [Synechocystis sp. PCC 7339]UAJ72633.1 DUF1232 domain-containing protein [Synechocystis sp. PCC 7339]
MIELLTQHIQNIHREYQINGVDIASISSYLKNDNINSIPPECIDLVLVIPEMLIELISLMREPSTSVKTKAIASGIYSYVFNPIDYIPDDSHSIFGFLDDALILYYGLQLIDKEPENSIDLIGFDKIKNLVAISESILSNAILEDLKDFPNKVSTSIQVN